jgi:hypothetical protein
MLQLVLVSSALSLAALGGCGGEDGTPEPLVGLIDDAIEATERHYGAPQKYFEISANLERVSIIVAVDGATAAEQGAYEPGGGFTIPEPVGPADGATFAATAVAFDPDRIFDGLRSELDDPVIVDFAIQGDGNGGAIYDASVASDAGGVLLVLLGPTGEILGAQGQ